MVRLKNAWNFIQGPILGVSVSGSSDKSVFLRSTPIEGKEWLTGGSFGIEGSVISVLAHLILLGIMVKLILKKKMR